VATPQLLSPLKSVHVHNRKYIGSKQHLLSFIEGVVAAKAPEATTLGDLFCGSGVVACHFAARGFTVTAADMLYHNYLTIRCFLGGPLSAPGRARVAAHLLELDALTPEQGYCSQEFGGTYFTLDNAGRIDAIRERIAQWAGTGEIDEQEEAILLTSLLYAADKAANTCGQYDAFLKHLGAEPYSQEGVHRVDAMVYKPLQLGLPQMLGSGASRALCGDANELAAFVDCDVLYLDPPYNSRQYVDNYHVLENIARWEKPALYGKTRKFRRDNLKSPYSRKRSAEASLRKLISEARCRHILLSYNNEGILSDEAIVAAMAQRGNVEVFTQNYNIFGNGAGRAGRRPIVERVFYCRVTTGN
jgi:adenine-specific DNA-methyltransferase